MTILLIFSKFYFLSCTKLIEIFYLYSMKAFYNLLLLLLLLLSCSNSSNYSQTIDNKDLFVVDIDKAEKKDLLHLSTLFKNVKCIPLELTDNSQIGSISKVLVYNDHIYVLDHSTAKSLFVFDNEGRFIRRIGNLGTGPGEYTEINDFTIDYDQGNIIITDYGKLLIYDILTGKHKNTVSLQYVSTIINIQYFNNKVYSNLLEYPNVEEGCLLQSIDMLSGKQDRKFLKANEHNKGWNGLYKVEPGYFIPSIDPPHLFRQIFMDTVFSITTQGLSPYFVIKSKDLVSEKDIKSIENSDNPLQLILALGRKHRIFRINSYFERDNFLYFTYIKDNNYFVTHDKSTNKTQVVKNIFNDLLYEKKSIPYLKVVFYDKSGVYECVHAQFLTHFLEENKGYIIDNKVKDKIKNIDEDSNPILFYYEFK